MKYIFLYEFRHLKKVLSTPLKKENTVTKMFIWAHIRVGRTVQSCHIVPNQAVMDSRGQFDIAKRIAYTTYINTIVKG